MKKRIVLLTAFAGLVYLTLSSNLSSPALSSAGNRTGARLSTPSCGQAGCHGTGTGTTVTITVDSATSSVPVTHYLAGKLYTIKIHGTSTLASTKYGFQFASVSGTGAAQVQAGTASALPTGVAAHNSGSPALKIVEHTGTLTSSTAGIYDVSFQWTAPSTGVGDITLYATLNAVNGDGSENNPDISGHTSAVLIYQSPLEVSGITEATGFKIFPNPAINTVNVQMENATVGTYSLQVFDLTGRIVSNEQVQVNSSNYATTLNTSNWTAGMYNIVIEKDGNSKVIPVVKQ